MVSEAVIDDHIVEAGRIGKNISDCMKHTMTTVDTLAAALNISDREVRCYIDGNAIPDPSILNKMSDYFKIPIDKICGEEPPFTSFGDELRKLRNAAGFTIADTSEYTGICPSSISKLESGKLHNIASDYVDKLSECFGDAVPKLVRKYNIKTKTKKTPGTKRREVRVATIETAEEQIESVTDGLFSINKEVVECKPDVELCKETSIRKEWVHMLEAIDDDREFRAIAMYIIGVISGGCHHDIDFEDMPQARLVKRLVDIDVAEKSNREELL